MNKKVLIGIIIGALVIVGVICALFLFGSTDGEQTPHTHTIVVDPAVPATCTTPGLSKGEHCSECGEVILKQRTLQAKHTIVIDRIVEATCKKTGLTEGSHCSVCGEVFTTQKTIPITDHKASNWFIKKHPSKTEEGIQYRKCTMCGLIMDEETIPATGSVGLKFRLNNDGESYTVIGKGSCMDEYVIIPSTYNGKPVTSIGNDAFKYSKYMSNNVTVSVQIPNTVTSIGDSAFYGCIYLESIVIPTSVTRIGRLAFSKCSSLRSIIIPDSVTELGSLAFNECESLETVIIGNSLTVIEEKTFQECESLESVIIGDSVTIIKEYAFYECYFLTSVSIPVSVTHIQQGVFFKCDLLTDIDYRGTKSQFYSIYKHDWWVRGDRDYTISCIDGDISYNVHES